MSERVIPWVAETKEDYDEAQAFKKSLRQRVADEATAEKTMSYRCDSPATRKDRRQIRPRAAAQEEVAKAEAHRAAIKTPMQRQRRKAA